MKMKLKKLNAALYFFLIVGCFSSLRILGTGCISSQNQSNSLYNPFLLENSNFPYRPISCVVTRKVTDRLRSDEAIEVIKKAFADSGIELEEKVWLGKENAGVYLNGYSEKDEIGFVFINRWNMDESFKKGNNSPNYKKRSGNKIELQNEIKLYKEIREGRFKAFLKNNNISLTNTSTSPALQKSIEIYQKYNEELSRLEAVESSRDEFYVAYLKHRISLHTMNIEHKNELIKNMLKYIDTRFDTSPEKLILLQNALEFRIPRPLNVSSEFITADFEKLKEIKSDKKFIEDFLTLKSFIGFNHSTPSLNENKEYQALKANIIHNYPLNKWFKNAQNLDSFYNKRFISLEEAKRIDKRNKSGKQFIAPISMKYDMMMYSQETSFEYPQEKYDELRRLRKEYSDKNALSPDVRVQQKKEYEELNKKYNLDEIRNLSQPKKDTLKKKRKTEYDKLQAKYKALEGLTEKEKAVYQSKIDEIMKILKEWSKNSRAEGKALAICKLEEEVKMYIQWVKSQRGN